MEIFKHFIFFLLFCFPVLANSQDNQKNENNQTEQAPKEIQEYFEELTQEPFYPEKEEPVDQSRFFNEFIHMLFSLGIIILVLLIIAWIVKNLAQKRMLNMNEQSPIKILASRSLSTKTSLHLIEISGQAVLIAETGQGVTRLLDFESDQEENA